MSISDWSKISFMSAYTKKNKQPKAEAAHSLTVSTMSVKKPKGTRGSGSSRKKSFKAPVMTWMSSQSLSSKFSFSSKRQGGWRREGWGGEGNREKFRQTGSEEVNERQGNVKRDRQRVRIKIERSGFTVTVSFSEQHKQSRVWIHISAEA